MYTNRPTPRYKPQTGKKRNSNAPLIVLAYAFLFACSMMVGGALYKSGILHSYLPTNYTATVNAQNSAMCEEVITAAINQSGEYCKQIGSETVCYGNVTLKAELAPNTAERFSERGDTIGVGKLQRLTAAPLNLMNKEWGIAIFKVKANLPRTLPGETVTMVVFGNTTFEKSSENLDAFYFYSDFGQVVCEKAPYDGMMITMPDGSGIQFNINGAQLTLKGSASVRSAKNGKMIVSMYKGSGEIVSNGSGQFIGAGQSVSVSLGGPNGVNAIDAPSRPQMLAPEERQVSCTFTGEYCPDSANIPAALDVAQAQSTIEAERGATSTPAPPTNTLSVAESTQMVLQATFGAKPSPTNTLLPGQSPVPTNTLLPGQPTNTLLPGQTPVPTNTSLAIVASTNTPIPTNTLAPTNTLVPTNTPVPTNTLPPPPTNTLPPPPTATNPPPLPVCDVSAGSLNINDNQLTIAIMNNGQDVSIASITINWNDSEPAQKVKSVVFGGSELWKGASNDNPASFSSADLGGDPTLDSGDSKTMTISFQKEVAAGNSITVTFSGGCSTGGSN